MTRPDVSQIQNDCPAPVDVADAPRGAIPHRWNSLAVRTTVLLLTIMIAGMVTFSLLSFGTLRSSAIASSRAAAFLEATLLADSVSDAVRKRDGRAATASARAVFRIEGVSIVGARAVNAAGEEVFTETVEGQPDIFDGMPLDVSLPTEAHSSRVGSLLLVRTPIHTPLGRNGPIAGVVEVIVDEGALAHQLDLERNWLVAASIALGLIMGALVFILLRIQLARPLNAAIAAMQAIALDRTDVLLPEGGTMEMHRISEALEVFRDNVVRRRVYAERSADAEARTIALQMERERSLVAEQAARTIRDREEREAAERQLCEDQMLQQDLGDVLRAASDGDLDVRMSLGHSPASQMALRGMLNMLLDRMKGGVDGAIDVLTDLEGGRLWARMEGQHAGVFARLQSSTNAMATRLESALEDLQRHATGILDDSSDLSASAEDLSKRTERTAGSLAETTNALEQIVLSIAATAELTASARGSAEAVRQEARRSDSIVQDAVQSMQEIQSVSTKISMTLDVINDIAFQTNLLALNAGVEAARAGEAGRGFAVVASEVRALAQRASDAARQIGELISMSSDQIEKGVTRVARTGQTLSTLGDAIERIGDQVTDIARATESQSSAAAEINRAMGEIDNATQQNTAMFEEVTTANLSLKGAASHMLRLIERFDLAGHDTEAGAGSVSSSPINSRPAAFPAGMTEQTRRDWAREAGISVGVMAKR